MSESMTEPLTYIGEVQAEDGIVLRDLPRPETHWGGGKYVLLRSQRGYFGPASYLLRRVGNDGQIESQMPIRICDFPAVAQMLLDAVLQLQELKP